MRLRFWRRPESVAVPEWTLVFYGRRAGDHASVRMWLNADSQPLIDICGNGWSRQLRRPDCKKIVLMRDIDRGTVLGVVSSGGYAMWIAEALPGATDELLFEMTGILAGVTR